MQAETFPGTLDALEPLRKYVTSAAESAGLDHSKVYGLCLAVDEIATNIVLHGYEEAGLTGDLTVTASVEPDRLVIDLRDQGKSYDPNFHAMPDPDALSLPLEDRSMGGLGILLAKDSVDDLQYTVTDRGNIHRFIVLRPSRPS